MHEDSGPVPSATVDAKLLTLREEEVLLLGRRFRPIPRVSIQRNTSEEVARAVDDALRKGAPVVIADWDKLPGWNKDAFGIDGLKDGVESERKLWEYATNGATPGNQGYFKDYPCPTPWSSALNTLSTTNSLLKSLLPLGGADLTGFLPESARPETLMTYIGHPSTHTPLHRDRCASVGQNLMVHASPNAEALWLICETGDAEKVGLHIRPVVAESGGKGRRRRGSKVVNKAGLDKEKEGKEKEGKEKTDEEGKEEEDTSVVEYERHLASLEEMVRAEFPVYVGCQRVGELVLLPPRSTHQVVNRHGLSCKIAWSRVTSESLGLAVERDLPLYNLLRVPEVYRIRLTLHHAVVGLSKLVRLAGTSKTASLVPWNGTASEARETLKQLLVLYERLMVEEWTVEEPGPWTFAEDGSRASVQRGSDYTHVRCDACSADIFRVAWACASEEMPPDESEDEPDEPAAVDKMEVDAPVGEVKKEDSQGLPAPAAAVGTPAAAGVAPAGAANTDAPRAASPDKSAPPPPAPKKKPKKPKRKTPWCANSDGDRVTLCSSCVVMGRACTCGTLTAHALLPYLTLLKTREDAQLALSGGLSDGGKNWEERREYERVVRSLIADGHLPVARAAELVAVRRGDSDKPVSCRYNNYHSTSWLASHPCKRCARRICFSCFASRAGVHAIELALCLRPVSTASGSPRKSASGAHDGGAPLASFAIPSTGGGPSRSILSAMPPPSGGPASASTSAAVATPAPPVEAEPAGPSPLITKFGRLDLNALFGSAGHAAHVDNDWVHGLHTGSVGREARHVSCVRLAEQLFGSATGSERSEKGGGGVLMGAADKAAWGGGPWLGPGVVKERIHPAPEGTAAGWYDPGEEEEEDPAAAAAKAEAAAAGEGAEGEGGDGAKEKKKKASGGGGGANGAAAGKKRKRVSEAGPNAGEAKAAKANSPAFDVPRSAHPGVHREREPHPSAANRDRERDHGVAVSLTDLPDEERRDYELAVELSGWRSTRRPRIELKDGATVDVVLPARRKSPARRVGADDIRRRRRSMTGDEDDRSDDHDGSDDGDDRDDVSDAEHDRKRARKESVSLHAAPPARNGLASILGRAMPTPPLLGPRGKGVRTNLGVGPAAVARPVVPSPVARSTGSSLPKKERDGSVGIVPAAAAAAKKEKPGSTSKPSSSTLVKAKSNGRPSTSKHEPESDEDMDVDGGAAVASPIRRPSTQVGHPDQPVTLEDVRARAAEVLGWSHLPSAPSGSRDREAYATKLAGRLLELVEEMQAVPGKRQFAKW